MRRRRERARATTTTTTATAIDFLFLISSLLHNHTWRCRLRHGRRAALLELCKRQGRGRDGGAPSRDGATGEPVRRRRRRSGGGGGQFPPRRRCSCQRGGRRAARRRRRRRGLRAGSHRFKVEQATRIKSSKSFPLFRLPIQKSEPGAKSKKMASFFFFSLLSPFSRSTQLLLPLLRLSLFPKARLHFPLSPPHRTSNSQQNDQRPCHGAQARRVCRRRGSGRRRRRPGLAR